MADIESGTGAEAKATLLAEPVRAALVHGALPGEPDALETAALDRVAHFLTEVASQRQPGQPVVKIESSEVKGAQHNRGRMHLMQIAVINDDMPFLVDSIANCFSACGLVIHRLLHPVLCAERDAKGVLGRFQPADLPGGRRESLIYIETDRVNAKQRAALEKALTTTLDHVRAAVSDWKRMQDALTADAERVTDDEGSALLRWLLSRNLTQTGYELRRRDGSVGQSLGICTLTTKQGGEPLLSEATIAAAFEWFEEGGRTPLVVKSNQASRVHRNSLIDMFIIPVREGKTISALSIHAGMWTSAALASPPDKVPVLRAALSSLMDKFRFDPSGHAGKALFHALTTLPHDIVISFDRTTLERLALTLMSLSDRPRPRLVLATAALARHLYAFVWLPRDDVSTARRVAIQNMLVDAANAPLLSWSIAMEENGLALLRVTLDLRSGGVVPDEALLDSQLKHMVRGWVPAVEAALADFEEAGRAAALAEKYAAGFPPNYRNGAGPEEAALDIVELHALAGEEDEKRIRLYRNGDDSADRLRLKLYSHAPVALSDAVPALENFGFKAIEELPTMIERGKLGHIQRFLLALRNGGSAQAVLDRSDRVGHSLANVINGEAEDDRFNELIVSAELDHQAVVLFRAIYRYLRQTGMLYAMATFVDTLRREQTITRALIDLFVARHDPAFSGDRDSAASAADQAVTAGLDAVSAIDDDRILRLVRAFVQATLRTNFFLPAGREALAFKLDSAKIPGLPAPLPWREIWVYSPRVEGIHLRAGPVARGGLRWSDRRDDFRTEILGLMKAQRVKNAVIVPTGAKGGFYPKQLPDPATNRDAWLAEGTESYRIFIRALLSVTDNIVAGKVKHPAQLVVHDGDDPYFVVAADKGTATFSDIANSIALERKFWLGDAFASGGSNGYDHKAMGITARGAWVSVQRHFAEMGTDVQSESIRVIGCGDMSGDVFGNGMLLSKAIKLVAAFDHRHIFIDPDPDLAKSWAERSRLFALPRSSWDDYDTSLISKGGGVFPRTLKSITLTPEMQAIIGTQDTDMEPVALISALLRAQADLLWFGGIGTYVKAASQSHSEVGDPANDRLRINAEDLRVRVVGEGANLGVTQAGRIAFSLGGGRINTDFIDNSAGVDCSDNEVNIKIALNREMLEGRLSFEDRNALLTRMTDDVAHLVLEDNRLQALGLSIAESAGAAGLPGYVHLIERFEASGKLDRAVEGLASNDQLLRRAPDGRGLTRPELAVLLSTAKLTLQDAIEHSNIASDPATTTDLIAAFPPEMQQSQHDAIVSHQLRGEIIATKLANRIVNRLGLIHPFELEEEEGCSLADMASAFVVAERIYDVDQLWAAIDSTPMPEAARLTLLGKIAYFMAGQMADIVRNMPTGSLPTAGLDQLKTGVERLIGASEALITEEQRQRNRALLDELVALGAPEDIARRTTLLAYMDGAVGLAYLSARLESDGEMLAMAFVKLGDVIGLDWLQASASRIAPSDPWERLLMSGVVRDMKQLRLDFLVRQGKGDPIIQIDRWVDNHHKRVQQFCDMLHRARTAPVVHAAMLAELANQARGLLGR
ncbi:NAD-glutamate dehydrogenase [Sphingobium subterraneum]|uniref:Glutamate dehydrogenase n=1 Tax=Sphingobium subterraneum TaxID=627688 RepID=A0A841J529_9SPHN|nr:NAD-glutamate dehydrogenase domain-containing protein [Sphingobium subterraneum]MBB6124636.1 glutamate dehydrogenase [Sphingobium subterraneum]